jgi:hypothetical protein
MSVDHAVAYISNMTNMFGLFEGMSNYLLVGKIFGWLLTFATMLYTNLFVRPLAELYMKGPKLFGMGMWEGMDPIDICAEISGFPSSHWAMHEEECLEKIRSKFESVVVVVWTTLVLLILYKVVSFAWYYWVVLPIKAKREAELIEAKAKITYDMLLKMQIQPTRTIGDST